MYISLIRVIIIVVKTTRIRSLPNIVAENESLGAGFVDFFIFHFHPSLSLYIDLKVQNS